MIERLLGSTWLLVAIWIVGPLVLFYILRRNRKRSQAPAGKSGGKGAPSPAQQRSTPGMPAPAVTTQRYEVTPGYLDMKWGNAPRPEMTLVNEDGEEKLYSRETDVLTLEGAPVMSILYSFHRDRLQAVMIDMPLDSADRVFKERCAQWGTPKQPVPRQPRYFWRDMGTSEEATQAVFERHAMGGKASLIISSRYIQEQRERERTAAARS